ncbi:esterase/lipase family protein [Nocardia sp. NPDC059240]|uniref:esterase/lipase family protein n=1 Tax=Nocardia sp. NPDC059240 TaxID=3346786 RepID=UPI0036B011E4
MGCKAFGQSAGAALAMMTVTIGVVVAATPVSADATSGFGPLDRPGPALSVPDDQLDASISCTANARDSERNVVLFVPGTGFTPQEDYGLSWFRAMDRLGWAYCSVTEPDHALGDAQISAQYVVNAIRHVHEISGHKVDIIGHSQGGTEPRFALRFWPDLRPLVDDYIGLAATNHGSVIADATCNGLVGCAPAGWQQATDSNYVRAMNSGQETFAGISYTDIYTHTDEVVQPNFDNTGSSSLHTGDGEITNAAVQDICPFDITDHIGVGTSDPVAYAIALDALTHPGPADPARVSREVCGHIFMPGVDPWTYPARETAIVATAAARLLVHARIPTEPKLDPYVYGN